MSNISCDWSRTSTERVYILVSRRVRYVFKTLTLLQTLFMNDGLSQPPQAASRRHPHEQAWLQQHLGCSSIAARQSLLRNLGCDIGLRRLLKTFIESIL